MKLNEGTYEVDGKKFANETEVDKYISRRITSIQKCLDKANEQLKIATTDKKECEDKLREYRSIGVKVQDEYDRNMDYSRRLRGTVGHDVDSEKKVKWMDNVKKYL